MRIGPRIPFTPFRVGPRVRGSGCGAIFTAFLFVGLIGAAVHGGDSSEVTYSYAPGTSTYGSVCPVGGFVLYPGQPRIVNAPPPGTPLPAGTMKVPCLDYKDQPVTVTAPPAAPAPKDQPSDVATVVTILAGCALIIALVIRSLWKDHKYTVQVRREIEEQARAAAIAEKLRMPVVLDADFVSSSDAPVNRERPLDRPFPWRPPTSFLD